MLLSSILRILDQHHEQPKVVEKASVEKFEMEIAPAVEEAPNPKKLENAAPKPANVLPPHAGTPSAGQGLEELIRAITKFEKSEQSRVVDVFE